MPHSSFNRSLAAFASRRRAALGSLAAATVLAATCGIAQAAAAAEDDELGEVVVTGTSIRGIAPTGSAPIAVERSEIDANAPRTTAELLAHIPQIAQFNAVPTGTTGFGAVVAQASLRPNLGANATLVLVNGHRIVNNGALAGMTDTSALAPSAISRVEVIADGASAIYGSDAVGGVINFITRSKVDRAETTLRYSSAHHNYTVFDATQLFERALGSVVSQLRQRQP